MEFILRAQNVLALNGYSASAESDMLTMNLRCDPLSVRFCLLQVQNYVTLLGLIPLYVPVYRKHAVSEGVARANWGLSFGTFEFDWSTGQIRFRASVWAPDGLISDEQLWRLVEVGISNVDSYAPAFADLICSEAVPEVSIARVEAAWMGNCLITDDDIPF